MAQYFFVRLWKHTNQLFFYESINFAISNKTKNLIIPIMQRRERTNLSVLEPPDCRTNAKSASFATLFAEGCKTHFNIRDDLMYA